MLFACTFVRARGIIPNGESCKEKVLVEHTIIAFCYWWVGSNLNSLNPTNKINVHN
jgi:hypothetical protein